MPAPLAKPDPDSPVTLPEILAAADRLSADQVEINTGRPPMARLDGVLVPLSSRSMTPETICDIDRSLSNSAGFEGLLGGVYATTRRLATDAGEKVYDILVRRDDSHYRGVAISARPRSVAPPKTLESQRLPREAADRIGKGGGLVLACGKADADRDGLIASMLRHVVEPENAHCVAVRIASAPLDAVGEVTSTRSAR